MSIIELFFKLIVCHLLGDYFLQVDYIAKTKGDNWYHLLVHCFLYVLPFYWLFGLNWQMIVILVSHFVIDALKARYKKINYITDQILHYAVLMVYFI